MQLPQEPPSIATEAATCKDSEALARVSETYFRSYFENIAVGAVQIDGTGRFIRVNDRYCVMTGYSREELLDGNRPLDLDHPEDHVTDQERVARYLRGEEAVYEVEKRYLRKDGTVVWVHVTATAIRDASGSLLSSVGVVSDITARKQAEQALQEKEERLSAILDAAPDAIIVSDPHGIIDSVNRAAETMFGYSVAELIGQNITILMSSPLPMIGTGHEIFGLRKNGSTFPVDLAVGAIHPSGLSTRILRDISEHKMLQKQVLEVSVGEQRRIGQELHDNTQQELAALTLMAGTQLDILAEVSAETLGDRTVRPLDESQYASLCAAARRLCEGLTATGQGVRQLAHGIMPAQINAQGLPSALDELAATTNGLSGVRCRFISSESITLADNTAATHLYRIAQEAVTNALRHSRADEIQISLAQQDTQLRLEIRDNGVGMDTSATAFNSHSHASHGMGLRIMEYRAGMIGGILQLECGPFGGTTVKCLVPSHCEQPS